MSGKRKHRDPFLEKPHPLHNLAWVVLTVGTALALSAYAALFWRPDARWSHNLLVEMIARIHQSVSPGVK